MTTSDTVLAVVSIALATAISFVELGSFCCNTWAWLMKTWREGGCAFWRSSERQEHQVRQQTRVTTRLLEMRAESYAVYFHAWRQISGAVAVVWLLRYVMGLPRLSNYLVQGHFGLSYLIGLSLQVYPNLLNTSTVWIYHHLCMGHLFCFGGYLCVWNPSWFVHYYPPLLVIRAMLLLAYPVARSNILWNAAWGLLAVAGYRDEYGASADVKIHHIISNEVLVALFLSHIVWKFELLQTSQVCSDFQANGYLRAKKTMERLLADMCDAVVELDSNLEIRRACPKLAGLLLRHTGTTALQGEPFTSLACVEEDRNRFRDFVSQRAVPMEHEQDFQNEGRERASMYLDLRDSNGTAVTVQLFHSCHHDPPDELCHVVGVHEVERITRENDARDTVGEVGHHINSEDDAQSVASAVSAATASDTPIFMAPVIPEDSTAVPVSVLLNPMTEEIVATSRGFHEVTGPILFKARLGDFVVNYDEFRTWLRQEVNGSFTDSQPQKMELKIAPSMLRGRAKLEFHADAFILEVKERATASMFGVERPEEGDEEEFDMLCVLVLSKPQPRLLREKRRSRGFPKLDQRIVHPVQYGLSL